MNSNIQKKKKKLDLAEGCLKKANDLSGLLLLYTATGNAKGIENLGKVAIEKGENNISFICYLLTGKVEEIVKLLSGSGRVAEAAFFSRTYNPSKVPEIVHQWRKMLGSKHRKLADSLADPGTYPNLFTPRYLQAMLSERESIEGNEINLHTIVSEAEKRLAKDRTTKINSQTYPEQPNSLDRDIISEVFGESDEGGEYFEETLEDQELDQELDQETLDEQELEQEIEQEIEQVQELEEELEQEIEQQPKQEQDLELEEELEQDLDLEQELEHSEVSNENNNLNSMMSSHQEDTQSIPGSENFSMDNNTAGTNSVKGDDLDISSFGANEDEQQLDTDDENFDF